MSEAYREPYNPGSRLTARSREDRESNVKNFPSKLSECLSRHRTMAAAGCDGERPERECSLRIQPGLTAATSTPVPRSSSIMACVNTSKATLEIRKAAKPATLLVAEIRLTILPERRATIAGTNNLHRRNGATRLTRIILSNAWLAVDIRFTPQKKSAPQFTMASTPPISRTTTACRRRMSASLDRSAGAARTVVPAVLFLARARNRLILRPTATTATALPLNESVSSRPRPDVAPVTRTRLVFSHGSNVFLGMGNSLMKIKVPSQHRHPCTHSLPSDDIPRGIQYSREKLKAKRNDLV
jgi:hypothetical protein